MNKNYDVIIIGAGPCGIGAAVTLKEAGINFAIIEKSAPGGKINIAPRVDNYPGFFEIPGPDLAVAFFERLVKNNIKITPDEVLSLEKCEEGYLLKCKKEEYIAKYVLVATGTTERKLGLPKEIELIGKGISYCAVCDGHFFKNKDVVIVGGGNSALKEAIHLATIVNKLYVVHRRNEFRGTTKTLNELKSHENVEIITPYVPVEILGEDKIEGLVIEHRETQERRILKVDGFFPLVGQDPNTKFVNIVDVLDEKGTIPFDRTNMQTAHEGLFAGGDATPRPIRQIYLAEHDGVVAAKSIIKLIKGQ